MTVGPRRILLVLAVALATAGPPALAGTTVDERAYVLSNGFTGTGALECLADVSSPAPDHGAICFDVPAEARTLRVSVHDLAPWTVGARARLLDVDGHFLGDEDLCGDSGARPLPQASAHLVVFLAGPATGPLTRLGLLGDVGPDCGPFGWATEGTVRVAWST